MSAVESYRRGLEIDSDSVQALDALRAATSRRMDEPVVLPIAVRDQRRPDERLRLRKHAGSCRSSLRLCECGDRVRSILADGLLHGRLQ